MLVAPAYTSQRTATRRRGNQPNQAVFQYQRSGYVIDAVVNVVVNILQKNQADLVRSRRESLKRSVAGTILVERLKKPVL